MTPVITASECSPDEGQGLARDLHVRWALGRRTGERLRHRRQCFGPLIHKQRFVSLNDGDRL
jgi:hypothetical protein